MGLFDIRKKHALPDAASALPGRETPMAIGNVHAVLATPLCPAIP